MARDYEAGDLDSLADFIYICLKNRKVRSHASLLTFVSYPLILPSLLCCLQQPQMTENGSRFGMYDQLRASLKLQDIVRCDMSAHKFDHSCFFLGNA